jgi:hypothetical protein
MISRKCIKIGGFLPFGGYYFCQKNQIELRYRQGYGFLTRFPDQIFYTNPNDYDCYR